MISLSASRGDDKTNITGSSLERLLQQSTPTVFKSVGASTHGFWQISHICINFHSKDMKNVMNLVIPWPKSNFKHPQFEIPNGDLEHNHLNSIYETIKVLLYGFHSQFGRFTW